MIGRGRIAVSAAFLAFGIAVGSLIPRLPALKDHLHLTDSQVGASLLGFSAGAVTGALLARLFLARGSRFYVRMGTVAICAALIGPGLAGTFPALVASFFVVGACAGFIDVLENAQGAELERSVGKPLINGFHGFWSLGAMLGSIVAGAAAYLRVAPLPQFAATALVVAAASAWFLRDLPDTRSGAEFLRSHGELVRIAAPFAILAVALLTFAGIIVEGSSADWSSLYLRDLSHASSGISAAGYAGFSLAALLVRFRADGLTARTSSVTVARLGAGTAVVGLTIAIAFPALPTAILGFALVGMGTAVILPLAFVAAANLSQSGTALSLVMSSGYAGSIVAPVLIGNAADRFGLRAAMVVPLLGGLLVVALAGYLRQAGWQMNLMTGSVRR